MWLFKKANINDESCNAVNGIGNSSPWRRTGEWRFISTHS